jgi:hypothetical protein
MRADPTIFMFKSCDSLNKWLRDIEAQIKEHDMKSTLPEKQGQVEKYKVRC